MPTRTRPSPAVTRTARILQGYLARERGKTLSLSRLEAMVECAFLASLRTEESQATVCTLAFLEPIRGTEGEAEPPDPSSRRCWRAFPFTDPIPLTPRNLVKLAPAANPAASVVLVHASRTRSKGARGMGGLVIWGLADQPASEWRAAELDGATGAVRPGLFQIEITGIGSLSVYDDRVQIADLRQNAIASVFLDVLREGEVHEALAGYCDLGPIDPAAGPVLAELIPILRVEHAATAVGRILSRMQRFRNGGALLFSRKAAGLAIKYAMESDRLREAVDGHLRATAQYMDASFRIAREYIDAGREAVPMGLYQDQAVARADLDRFDQAVSGAIGFVASLTRVDGLVLIGPRLHVRGFGVEIGAPADPDQVVAADSVHAPGRDARPLDLSEFGTRHRSMMRHCFRDPDALGFVVSQDGEVRAMRRVGDRLVVWENIKIRAFEQSAPPPPPASAAPRRDGRARRAKERA